MPARVPLALPEAELRARELERLPRPRVPVQGTPEAGLEGIARGEHPPRALAGRREDEAARAGGAPLQPA